MPGEMRSEFQKQSRSSDYRIHRQISRLVSRGGQIGYVSHEQTAFVGLDGHLVIAVNIHAGREGKQQDSAFFRKKRRMRLGSGHAPAIKKGRLLSAGAGSGKKMPHSAPGKK